MSKMYSCIMRKHLYILALISFGVTLQSQNGLQLQYKLCNQCQNGDEQNIDYTYDNNPSDYETFHIESDYDMRITNGTSGTSGS